MIPDKLKYGDEIRVIAPSRSMAIISEETINLAKERLENEGFKVTFGKNVMKIDEDFKCASIEDRINDLHDAFKDNNVKAILTVIGGFNSNQLLDYIDYELIKNNPKIFCGFSDITAMSNSIYAKTGLVTYSGVHFSSFGMKKGFEYSLNYFKKMFMQDQEINIQIVSQVISVADISDVIKLSEYIIKKNIKQALDLIENITSGYIDALKLAGQLLEVFKYIMIIKISDNNIILELEENILDIIKNISQEISIKDIYYILDIFSDGYDKIYKSSSKPLELEISVMKAIYRDNNLNNNLDNNLDNKIKKLELEIKILKDKINNLDINIYKKQETRLEDQSFNNISDMSIYENSEKISNWNEILNILSEINPGLFAALSESKGHLNKDAEIVFIETDNQFFLDLIRSSSQAKQSLKQAIFRVLNKKYRIGPYKNNNKKLQENADLISDIESLAKENNIKINIK